MEPPKNSSQLRPAIDLREILEHFDGTLSVVGLFINGILLFLILRRMSENLKEYKGILLQNCIVDIIYNLADGITRTQSEYKNGNFFLIMTSAFGKIPIPLNNYLICIWIFALYFCVTTLPVQFVWRYCVICRGIKLSRRYYLLMLSVAFWSAFILAIFCLYTFWTDIEAYEIKVKLLEADAYYWRERPNFIIADIRYFSLIGVLIYCYFLISTSYITVLWASYKVWKYMRTMQYAMTAQTKDVHNQMTKTLVVQALVPLFVTLFPTVVTITMVFAYANIPGVGETISLLWSWIPVANPLMTILVVKTFRNSMFGWLEKVWVTRQRVNPSTTMPIVSAAIHTHF